MFRKVCITDKLEMFFYIAFSCHTCMALYIGVQLSVCLFVCPSMSIVGQVYYSQTERATRYDFGIQTEEQIRRVFGDN